MRLQVNLENIQETEDRLPRHRIEDVDVEPDRRIRGVREKILKAFDLRNEGGRKSNIRFESCLRLNVFVEIESFFLCRNSSGMSSECDGDDAPNIWPTR